MLTLGELPIEAVIVSSVNGARVFYSPEGDRLCYSRNGEAPEAASAEAQANKCSICVQNQWGSKITGNGKRAKACSEFAQLKLRTLDDPAELLSLRVPPASLKAFRAYEKEVQDRGEKLRRLVTKIAVTDDVLRSSLTFRVTKFLTQTERTILKQSYRKSISPFAKTDGFTV